jgi:hypothetical protein
MKTLLKILIWFSPFILFGILVYNGCNIWVATTICIILFLFIWWGFSGPSDGASVLGDIVDDVGDAIVISSIVDVFDDD